MNRRINELRNHQIHQIHQRTKQRADMKITKFTAFKNAIFETKRHVPKPEYVRDLETNEIITDSKEVKIRIRQFWENLFTSQRKINEQNIFLGSNIKKKFQTQISHIQSQKMKCSRY